MKFITIVYVLLAFVCSASLSAETGGKEAQSILDAIKISYEQFTLDNGLRVVVHTDHNAPVVNISVRYHVGSKDEPKGRSGFAHLFEHLMFNGSTNYPQGFMKGLDGTGAKSINGITSVDKTLYYETVPTSALERTLWLESDRMANLLINQELLDSQRSVVKNEKRQKDNNPTGGVRDMLQAGLFPVDHPYHHSIIGSMQDLNSATVEEVQNWYQQYYGASNALLVMSGDVSIERAKTLVKKYFSHVPQGKNITRYSKMSSPKLERTFQEMETNVTSAQINRHWRLPSLVDDELLLLEQVSSYIGGGRKSPLYNALVKSGLANRVSLRIQSEELASRLMLEVNFKDINNKKAIEAVIDDEFKKFMNQGPDMAVLNRINKKELFSILGSIESVGAKGSLLAEGIFYQNNPLAYRQRLKLLLDVNAEQLKAVAKKWLGKGFYQLTLVPKKSQTNIIAESVDLKKIPALGEPSQLSLPVIETAMLDNGIQVQLSKSDKTPFIRMKWLFSGGQLAEGDLPAGTSSFVVKMIDEGTDNYTAESLQIKLNNIGSRISISKNMSWFTVSSTMLASEITDTLTLVNEVIQKPTFPQQVIEKKRQAMLMDIKNSEKHPSIFAENIYRELLLDQGHPYALANSNTGTIEQVNNVSKDDILSYYRKWIIPSNVTIFIVGNTSMEQILPLLNKQFGQWHSNQVTDEVKAVAKSTPLVASKIFLVNRPDAIQTLITAAQVVDIDDNDESMFFGIIHNVFGRDFTSRLNLNLRKEKGWAYRAKTYFTNKIWSISSSVQTDKTDLSVKEILKELDDIRGKRPVTKEELDALVSKRVSSLPASFAHSSSVLGFMINNFKSGKDAAEIHKVAPRLKSLTSEKLTAVAQKYLHPKRMIWVIQGDLSKIEQSIRDLNLGDVEIIELPKT